MQFIAKIVELEVDLWALQSSDWTDPATQPI